ncbi:MAG: phage late control D family protein [Deltaproteobacteria bacterium]|nr:phage late control D family protein [Deltaproteobacteria bacterium]
MPEETIPQYKVLINGRVLPVEVEADIISVTVSKYTEGSDLFSIEMNNSNSDKQEYKWLDNDQFAVGTEVEIKMGYTDNLNSLIKGEITGLEPEFHNERASILKVHGYDRLHRFRRGRKTRSFIEKKDSQVVEKVAQDLNLKSQVVDTQIVHPYLLQNNQTDIDFLLERAWRIRYDLQVEDRTLIFQPVANDRGKTVTLNFGEKMKSFYPRLTTVGQVSEVIVRGWNPKTKEVIIGSARAGDEVSKMEGNTTGPELTENAFGVTKTVIVDKYIFSQSEADQIAKGKYNDMAVNFITGEGTAIGIPTIAAGDVIELNKLGKRFNGFYYVTSISHVIHPSKGYEAHFCVERNAV